MLAKFKMAALRLKRCMGSKFLHPIFTIDSLVKKKRFETYFKGLRLLINLRILDELFEDTKRIGHVKSRRYQILVKI